MILISIVSLSLILCGFLVKRFPMLIAGYNTMSPAKKKLVDIKGLSTFLCRCLVFMGVGMLVLYLLFRVTGWDLLEEIGLFFPLVVVPYCLIRADRYNHNPKSRLGRDLYRLTIFGLVGVIAWVLMGIFPAEIKIENEKLLISGMYGTKRSLAELESIQLSDTIPTLSPLFKGFSFGKIRKGWFKSPDGSKVLLYLSSAQKPFICIKEKSGVAIYLNKVHSEATKRAYEVVKRQMIHELRHRIEHLATSRKATVGVAVWFDNGDTLTVNNHRAYPMMSVYKFPLALTVLDFMHRKGVKLDEKVSVSATELLPETYSPLREAYPKGGRFTLADLLRYAVSLSDNHACDILFRYVGGTQVVQDYVARLGFSKMVIRATEEEMHARAENEALNHSTPFEMVRLLERFERKELLPDSLHRFLEHLMIETSTGADKIKAGVPQEVVVGHKTGSSSRNGAGVKLADNDLAFVRLPDGRHYLLSVFVADSQESDAVNAEIIAEVSKVVYHYYR